VGQVAERAASQLDLLPELLQQRTSPGRIPLPEGAREAMFTASATRCCCAQSWISRSSIVPVAIGLARAIIALAFQPLREGLRHLADRLVFGARAKPHEVLARFSHLLTGAPALSEVLPAVGRATAEAAGAAGAEAVLYLPGRGEGRAAWGGASHRRRERGLLLLRLRARSRRGWAPAALSSGSGSIRACASRSGPSGWWRSRSPRMACTCSTGSRSSVASPP
jgi:hypothetical protein